jgi:hypothetical protein
MSLLSPLLYINLFPMFLSKPNIEMTHVFLFSLDSKKIYHDICVPASSDAVLNISKKHRHIDDANVQKAVYRII